MFDIGSRRGFTHEKQMTDSRQLLAEYVANGSETAFRELVGRYINLVYSTALRLVGGDPQLAEDVTQTVFISLAKKGRTLSSGVMLGGWLHRCVYHVATKAARSERRRQNREREAAAMNTLQDDSAANLQEVAPVLDEAITQLGNEDRAAILLRFFEQRDFRSVAEALGSTEDAARMRVNRALEKLHVLLTHRGVALSITALGTVLTAEAVKAAPAGLAVTISSAALGATAASASTTFTLLKSVTMTKLQAAIVGAMIVAGVATPLVIRHQARLRAENQSLRQQMAQLETDNERLAQQVAQLKDTPASPAPVSPAGVSSAVKAPGARSPFQQLNEFLDTHQGLSREEVEAYLQQNKRNAENLLAAYRMSRDPSYLREAAANFPNIPSVQFAVIADNIFPGEQRGWIEAFRASSAGNALAWYFSALDYFNSKQPDLAVRELAQAMHQHSFDTYAAQATQAVEEMCALAGWPPLAARAWAPSSESASYLASLKNLANQMMQAQQEELARGDAAGANSLMSMGMVLVNTLRSGSPMDQLVGIGIGRKMLGQLDPALNYGFLERAVSEELAALDRQKQTISEALAARDQVLPALDEAELASYFERKKLYGEVSAVQWLRSKHDQP